MCLKEMCRKLILKMRVPAMMLLDSALFNAAVVIAFLIRFAGTLPPFNFWSYRDVLYYFILVPPLSLLLFGAYGRRPRRRYAEECVMLFKAIVTTLMLLLFVVYVYREWTMSFPTTVFFLSVVTAWSLLSVSRLVLRRLAAVLSSKETQRGKTLLVGSPDMEAQLRPSLSEERIVASITPPLGCDTHSARPSEDEVAKVLADEKPDEIIMDVSSISAGALRKWVMACHIRGIHVMMIPCPRTLFLAGMRLSPTDTGIVGNVPPLGIAGWHYVAKSLFDLLIAMSCLVLLLPVLLVLCCVIVIDSKGWPIFTQLRIGKNGKPFYIYKLRTMMVDADRVGPELTRDNDPRITRVGRWLRRWSLDELPQLVNVVKGQMSLIGPRAVIPQVIEQQQPWEKGSLAVKPGITGLAQIHGRNRLGFVSKSALNLLYILRHSWLLDLGIMVMTLKAVVSGKGTGGTRLSEDS